MKLQKLCYYAQALYMSTHNGESLFEEDFEARIYRPVIRALYYEFRDYGWRSIEEEVELPEMEQDKVDIIKLVVEAYGRYDGAALSTMTHREEPWLRVREGLSETEGSNALIPKESLIDFFGKTLASYVGLENG